MRIAIPVTKGEIPNHLGHCESFLIADVEDGRITHEVELPNPGHGPGGPPPIFVAQQGVTHVLAWGMPPHAQGLFAQAGIEIQLGARGTARDALRAYLDGTIELTAEGLDAGGGCGQDDPDHHP